MRYFFNLLIDISFKNDIPSVVASKEADKL